jgi:hypothetical protein
LSEPRELGEDPGEALEEELKELEELANRSPGELEELE